MQFTFLDMAGGTLFVRDDAERAQWTQEEMTLDCDFPYLPDKAISTGQRVFFVDPATGAQQIYEIKQARTFGLDSYQQITAENICISELSDEHIDNKEITNATVSAALSQALQGTLWSIGNVDVNPTSSADLSRGSVWQAVLQIKDNWNVYIEPRTALAQDGSITRFLDVKSTAGVWNGVRLSIDKNMVDPSVTFDDSEVATALFGYGGTVEDAKDPDASTEVTFADVAWSATDGHPAKPLGQTYLEDPAATAEFGRNGRARFGLYQNNDITDPETLLQKTWETLQTVSSPAISVEGTVADLYRLGYADQPIALHDIALVEIQPTGFKKQIQIIRMTSDLLDPTATSLTIGAYIPNIIYIERKTNESATGSRGGGGGNKAQEVNEWQEFRTTIEAYKDGTGMQIKSVQNDLSITNEEVAIQSGRIEVNYNKITAEVQDRRDADNVLQGSIQVQADRITAEVKRASTAEGDLSGKIQVEADRITAEVTRATTAEETLSSSITVTADAITAEVTRATEAEGALSSSITATADAITAEVTRATTAEGTLSSNLQITADAITAEVTRATTAEGTLSSSISANATAISAEVTRASNAENSLSGRITVNADKVSLVVEEKDGRNVVKAASIVAAINDEGSSVKIQADHIILDGAAVARSLEAQSVGVGSLTVEGQSTFKNYIYAEAQITCEETIKTNRGVTVGNSTATWKSATLYEYSTSASKNFVASDESTVFGALVTGNSTTTIYYLGR